MTFKMTEEFASAMVTVIPIILLAASVEVSSLVNRQGALQDELLRQLQQQIDAKRRGEEAAPLRVTDTGPTGCSGTALALFWFLLSGAHVIAEYQLIMWLAGTERGDHPLMAKSIAFIGIIGFAAVLVGWLWNLVVTSRSRSRELARLSDQLEDLRRLDMQRKIEEISGNQ
ncbi:hypothetical protein ACPCSK_34430 [Streptomyces griseoincarnatus]